MKEDEGHVMDTVEKYETYEDYLDSQVLVRSIFSLRDAPC